MKEKIIKFIKENWFKISLIILGIIFILFNRYYFMHIDGSSYIKCDKFIGKCILGKAVKIKNKLSLEECKNITNSEAGGRVNKQECLNEYGALLNR